MNKIADENLTKGTLSPFLPGTNVMYAWDSTCLGLLKQCPRLYQYTIIDGWQAKDENVHLRFGGEYHSTLEEYDRLKATGSSHEDAMREAIHQLLIRTWDYPSTEGLDLDQSADMSAANAPGQPWTTDPNTKAGKYKNRWSLVSLIIDYLDKFADDPAETFILEDGKPGVELSFRFELDWGPQRAPALVEEGKWLPNQAQPYLLCGHLDRVVTFNDSLFVMDHKTSKTQLGDYYFDQFHPNNQMTLYALAGKVVINAPLAGVIIDGAQILLEKPNAFKRGMTYRTKEQLDEWLADLEYWLRQAEAYATAGHWPMNDTACDKFGGCRFREVCSKSPQVRKIYLKSNFDQLAPEERWNQMKER